MLEAQLIQDSPDHLRVRLVPNRNYGNQDKAQIISNLQERLGNKIIIEIEEIDQIPRTPNGKFRYVISKVPLNLSDARQTGEVLGLGNTEDQLL